MTEKNTVLVIDDASDVRKVLRFHLERKGYCVLEAEDGEKGLEQIYEHLPQLIILDINMPKKTGLEVYKELRLSDKKISSPILILTSREELGKMFRDLDVDGFVTKPFVVEDVISEIGIIMRKRYSCKEGNGQKKIKAKQQVLIVEENEQAFTTIAVEFLKEGYLVGFASSAGDAFEKITMDVPDVLVINLRIQDLSGDSFVAKLKRIPKTMDMPLVLYTTYDDTLEETVIKKISEKVQTNIIKGNEPGELLKEAKRLLKNS